MKTRSQNLAHPLSLPQKKSRRPVKAVRQTITYADATVQTQASSATNKKETTEEKLNELYTNIKSVPNYSAKIGEFLRQNELHSTHKRIVKNKFPRRRVISRFPFELFMADLIDYRSYSRVNKGYRYILVMIDCFTRMTYTAPLTLKNAENTAQAFESIFSNFSRFPINLVTDDGLEFFNSRVHDLFTTYGINHYSTPTKTKQKASLAERVIRTLKTRLQRYFDSIKKPRWVDVLSQITTNYNQTPHRSIGMAPVMVTDANRKRVYKRLYPHESLTIVCRLREGDKVRRVIEKTAFAKGYTENWSSEVFVIRTVRQSNTICYYKIKTLANKLVPGIFYYYQLNLVSRNVD